MNDPILHLNQVSKGDVAIAGGKGANLGELIKIGMPVPEGVVVTTGVYRQFVEEQGIRDKIQEKLKGLDIEDTEAVGFVSDELQKLILERDIQQATSDKILDAFKKFGAQRVAVRSSATAEDAARTSWAGQLSTYLSTTEKDLIDNIKRCWASLFSPRALHYRVHHKVEEEVSVAVIVQKMVEAEVSGIVFTVHPVTRDPDMLLIEAGWGLGEAMVQGLVTPDNYIIDKKNLDIYDFSIGKQKKMVILRHGGAETVDVPKEKQEVRKLSEEKAKELARLCIRIENHYQHPQDIEWTLEEGKLWILQSRPITTL